MTKLLLAIVLLALGMGSCLAANHVPPASSRFTLVGDFPLGPSANRTDYESLDVAARRLYVAKMGAGQLLVFDIAQNRLVASLDGFPKVTGVLAVPELHRVYASVPGAGLVSSLLVGLGMAGLSRGHGAVAILDTRTLKEIKRLPGGVFPDGIAYDPKERRVFVSDELGSAVTVIDAETDKPLARIDMGGEVGNVRYDPVTGAVYAAVQSHNELLRIDPERAAVVTKIPLAGCDHPHGFIPAPSDAIGYAACDENDRLVVVDLSAKRVLGNLPVAHDPDVLAIDAPAKRLYVAAESGNLSTYDIANTAEPRSLGEVFVAEGAHAVAVDPVTHRLYFDLADLNGHAAMRVLAPK